MGRKQTILNVQNRTSTSIRYEDFRWANKTRQGFAHSTFVLFDFILCWPHGTHALLGTQSSPMWKSYSKFRQMNQNAPGGIRFCVVVLVGHGLVTT